MGHNIVAAAKEAGIKHIIRMSGAGADVSAKYLIAKEHGMIDQEIMDSGITYTFLRNNFFMQNYINWARDMVKSGMYYNALHPKNWTVE